MIGTNAMTTIVCILIYNYVDLSCTKESESNLVTNYFQVRAAKAILLTYNS